MSRIEGSPGTGKATIAIKVRPFGERGLYITLSETKRELRACASSYGWELGDTIEVSELVLPEPPVEAEFSSLAVLVLSQSLSHGFAGLQPNPPEIKETGCNITAR